MTKEEFVKFKEEVDDFLTITPDNVTQKSIRIPIFYEKTLKHYLVEKKKLKTININKDKLYGELYHKYKYEFDYKLDTRAEIEAYVYKDDEFHKARLAIQNQEAIVDYLKETLSNVNKVGFAIGHYIELLKIKHGTGF